METRRRSARLSFRIRFITFRSSLCSRLLWNRFAIGTGICAGEVHFSLCVSHHRFPLPHRERKWLKQLNLVPALRQFVSYGCRNGIFHLHVAAFKSSFRKPWLLQRRLHVHSVIHHVCDQLRVRLSLVPASPNTDRK